MYNVRFFVLVNLSSPPILCQTLIKSESIYNTTVNMIIKICNFFEVIHVEEFDLIEMIVCIQLCHVDQNSFTIRFG